MNFLKSLFKTRSAETEDDEDGVIEDERELGSVNRGLNRQNRIVNWLVAFGACTLAAVFLYKYYANMFEEHQRVKATAKDLTRTVATTGLPPLMMPDAEPENRASAPVLSDSPPPLLPRAESAPGAGSTQGHAPAKTTGQLARERKLKREVRFSLEGHLAGASAVADIGSHAAVVDASTPSDSIADGRGALGPVSGNPVSAGFAPARAYLLPDPALMMTRGKLIRCTVLPALDTTLPGPVTCVTGEDATGADNRVSLMDRGTICFGEQGGGVTQGQRRVGIIWKRCETPQHALVPFDSRVADALGRIGIPGTVDNHFWDRFGGAIALSLITDIGPYLIATRNRGDNNTTVSFPPISGPKDVLTEVLKSTIDIAPTITAPQGAEVLIYLASDIDFRDIYTLQRVR